MVFEGTRGNRKCCWLTKFIICFMASGMEGALLNGLGFD